MPKPMAVVDYEECHPEQCEKEFCVAVVACPTKTLKQEAAYEVPYLVGLCRGAVFNALWLVLSRPSEWYKLSLIEWFGDIEVDHLLNVLRRQMC